MHLRELIKEPAKTARKLNLSYNTVNNWIKNNAVPPKRARALSEALDIDLKELLPFVGYSKSRAQKPIMKTEADLEALMAVYKGAPPPPHLPEKSIQLTLTKWGDRFPLLYATLMDLKERNIGVKDAAERLDLSISTIHGLRRRYGLAPGPLKAAPKPPKNEKKALKRAAFDVISGSLSAVAASKHHNVNLRTLHRHIEPLLKPQTQSEISHWSKVFRRALAWEIDHGVERFSVQWREQAEQRRLILPKKTRWPAPPKDMKKASIRDMLVTWLGGEALESIAVQRGGEAYILKGLFDKELAKHGITNLDNLSDYHKFAAGEVIIAFMSPFRSEAPPVEEAQP